MDHIRAIRRLQDLGIVPRGEPSFRPLTGGVSSDILLVESGGFRCVLKSSLSRLKVADDWRCDTIRNVTEARAIAWAHGVVPTSVPRLLHVDEVERFFVMEYLGDGMQTWKSQLLAGLVDPSVGETVGRLLATIHAAAWNSEEVRARFDTGRQFHELRVEPYLLTTGVRHPALRAYFEEEVDRLREIRTTLVHGDWSAKNILVGEERIVVLDWEVACWGDPAFDSAFLLNLLYLKSLYRRERLGEYLKLARTVRRAYEAELPWFSDALQRRICRLTQLLVLARIDGKSPAEYITDEDDKETVREFVRASLHDGVASFEDFDRRWTEAVEER